MASGILSDVEIEYLCREKGMIEPYSSTLVRQWNGQKVISFGQSSFGYDIRVASEFKIFTNTFCAVVDPKALSEKAFVGVSGVDHILIPPNSFALARSVEQFKIPEDVTGIVLGKSTYARCGIVVNCTPMEAGWRGYLTIEISNTTPLPAKIYANEGIAQVLLFRGSQRCAVSYNDRDGKYQAQQAEIVLPRV